MQWFFNLFKDSSKLADRFSKAHGKTARDVMTAELATVGEDATADDIAKLMEARNIRRVPVVKDGRLAGIVSRADLLRAVLAPKSQEALGDDAAILRAALSAMRDQPWVDSFGLPGRGGRAPSPSTASTAPTRCGRAEGARGGNPRREARRGQDGADADPGADADLIRHDPDRHRRGAHRSGLQVAQQGDPTAALRSRATTATPGRDAIQAFVAGSRSGSM